MIYTTGKGSKVEILVKDHPVLNRQVFVSKFSIDGLTGFIMRDSIDHQQNFINELESEKYLTGRIVFSK